MTMNDGLEVDSRDLAIELGGSVEIRRGIFGDEIGCSRLWKVFG